LAGKGKLENLRQATGVAVHEGNAQDRPLTPAAARDAVAGLFDHPSTSAVGVEIELLTYSAADRRARPTLDQISAAVSSPLPAGGALTIEPGGQIELSTLPFADDIALNRAIADDLDALKKRLADCDVCVDAVAIDMDRPPQRIRPDARYRLMEEHFERCGPAGRWMMNNTASTQLNVSMPGSTTRAWRLLHAIGPLLTAAFANSPGRCADGTSWASLRQGCWLHIDRTRTAAPGPGIDPIEEYLQYVMASRVFVVPGGDGPIAPPPGLTMGAWIHHGVAGRHATLADLRYHLTTLFPPVRPRGWFELRMIDSVPETDLPSVVAVGMALLDEPTVDELTARTITCPGGEFDAARYGLSAA
jgi:glutamate--cysteine ligase